MDMAEAMLAHDPRVGEAVREGRYGLVLRSARVVRGLTLEEAGAKTGYTKSTLSRIENGRRLLTIEDLQRFAKAYELPPGMLGLSGTTVLPSAPQRLQDARKTRGQYPLGDTTRFISASIMDPAPDFVCDALDLKRGSRALHREQLTYRGEQPVRLSATWVPGDIADRCPALLGPVAASVGISGLIKEATGRIADRGEDRVEPCVAWPEAARRLGRKEGFPMLRTLSWWRDSEGVVQYVESVTPYPVQYPYDL